MARRLGLPAMSPIRAGALCALVALSSGSVHLAWGSVADTFIVDKTGHEPSVMAPMLAAFQSNQDTGFTPDALIIRPLFSASRRPRARVEPVPEPPPQVVSIAPPPEEPPPVYIVGGVIVSSGIRKILLRREPREPAKWLNQGEMTGEGWTIASIRADAVVLERGGREVEMPLRVSAVSH
jgi:hypothetical protein